MATARDLALTDTGDLDLTAGGVLLTGKAAIRQELLIRLKTFVGEYFLDTRRGLSWLAWTGSDGRKLDAAVLRQIEALVRAEIVACAGVVRVDPSQVVATYNSSTRTVTVLVAGVTTDEGLLDAAEVTI
uniref:Putative structural protein n=1 Tax=viral metagenome TaxID=1070528 RepID=A0A6M3J9U3_9ZZZZ